MISMMQMMLWGGAGDLDSTFGGDGKVTTAVGSSSDYAESVAIQSDGKIVVAGISDIGSKYNFAVVRYDTSGNLDSSFDGDGKVTTAIGGGTDEAQSVAIQSDGKIVVAGISWNGSNHYDFAVVRYDTSGNLDSTFGNDGKVTTAIGSDADYAQSVAIQSDGKIVVVGSSYNGSSYDFAVVRYDTSGNLDSTFGGDGKVITDLWGERNDYAYSVAIQSDGKIVAVGVTGGDFALVRYNTDGTLDTSFNFLGRVIIDLGSSHDYAQSVAIQSDGKIVAAGYSWNGSSEDFALVRCSTDGSLDNTFDGDGKVMTDIGSNGDRAQSVAIQSDGKIVAAGISDIGGYNYDFAVVRYDTDGSLDGIVTTDVGSGSDLARSVAIQSDGKIIVAGKSLNGSNNDFAVVRYIGIGGFLSLAPIYYLLQ